MQLWTYLQMPAMAIGAAVSAMAAQNIGAGKWERVSTITRARAWSQALVITGVLVLLLAVADRPALALVPWRHTAPRCRSRATSS